MSYAFSSGTVFNKSIILNSVEILSTTKANFVCCEVILLAKKMVCSRVNHISIYSVLKGGSCIYSLASIGPSKFNAMEEESDIRLI